MRHPLPLLRRQLGLERGGDVQRHVGLDLEDVREPAVIGLGPQTASGRGIDELRHDAHPLTGSPAAGAPACARALAPYLESFRAHHDIVILDARTGAELLRLTHDESSFDPVWSPAGDAIAFFRVDHGLVDLELVRLNGSAPNWTLGQSVPLTDSAGLDAGSRPTWYIPPDQMPTPGPSVQATAQPFPTLQGPSASSAAGQP